MNTMISIIAAVSAGIATTSALLLLADILKRVEVEKDVNAEAKVLPLIFKLLLPLSPSLKGVVNNPMFNNMRTKSEEQLQMAGLDHAMNANELIAIRIMYVILGGLFMLMSTTHGHPLLGLAALGLMGLYPDLWLRSQIKRRHTEILKALPNILDLLTLSVEAGKDFMSALRDILKKRRNDALAEELNRTFSEIQLGKNRAHALKDMSKRVRQPDLTTVLNSIIQAEELGVSIAELLRIQGDLLRNKRFSRAEKLANEAPVKILLPMLLFIFPSVIIILLGPSLMQAMKFMF